MLNRVRNAGFGDFEFSVVWLQLLAAPTIIVAWGPRSISEAMSTTYDTDMFEPLAIGNWNPGPITPITMKACPFSSMFLPTISGLLPKWLRHRP